MLGKFNGQYGQPHPPPFIQAFKIKK